MNKILDKAARLLAWIFLLMIALIFIYSLFYFFGKDDHCSDLYGCIDEEKSSNNMDIDDTDRRYRNADSLQLRCISTLEKGAYAYKSLAWKLDACNVP